MSECHLIKQGYERGSCLTIDIDGSKGRACQVTLRYADNKVYRLVKSAHLSRPEHYLSIYQSGCNFSCLKCHSSEFSQKASGEWLSPDDIVSTVMDYSKDITYYEPRDRATAFHAQDLCLSCGRCIYGERSKYCPKALNPEQIVWSPQGWGPARNIVGFTGGDITCRPEFYEECTKLIKKEIDDIWVLIETNGYGLTPENLERLRESGVDSFWLDIKAFDDEIHKKLTGVSNKNILELPYLLKDNDFVFEVLTLYIPGMVEKDQILKIANILRDVDRDIPFTILAFFPSYKLSNLRSPTLYEMIAAYFSVKPVLNNVRLGNIGTFVNTIEEYELVRSITG